MSHRGEQWEAQLRAVRDDAWKEMAATRVKATDAVRARNQALKRYRKAQLAFVEYLEAKESELVAEEEKPADAGGREVAATW